MVFGGDGSVERQWKFGCSMRPIAAAGEPARRGVFDKDGGIKAASIGRLHTCYPKWGSMNSTSTQRPTPTTAEDSVVWRNRAARATTRAPQSLLSGSDLAARRTAPLPSVASMTSGSRPAWTASTFLGIVEADGALPGPLGAAAQNGAAKHRGVAPVTVARASLGLLGVQTPPRWTWALNNDLRDAPDVGRKPAHRPISSMLRSLPLSRFATHFNQRGTWKPARQEPAIGTVSRLASRRPTRTARSCRPRRPCTIRIDGAGAAFKAAIRPRSCGGASEHRLALACSGGQPQRVPSLSLIARSCASEGRSLRQILRRRGALSTSKRVAISEQPLPQLYSG